MGRKKVADGVLVEAYERLGSVWKVAEEVGLCGQTVHGRLGKIGKISPMNVFLDNDKAMLVREYEAYKNRGQLVLLAKKMGRTKQFICRQARELGLTNQKSPRPYAEKEGSNPYAKLHARVRSLRGSPHKCEMCGEDSIKKHYDWANLTGDYENPDDYKRMCRKCHREYDKNRPILTEWARRQG